MPHAAIGQTLELTGIRSDGTHFPLELSLSVGNPSGKQFALAMVRDISNRRQREEELRRVKEQVVEADRSKSEFLANISHELRTPLHGILSYAKFGLDEADTAERSELHEFFHHVDHCADNLLHLVNDLLDLSKLEAGRMSFEFQPGRPGQSD